MVAAVTPSGFPEATRKDHQTFCVIEGWTQVANARGKTGHHVTYELALPDGRILRTRVSHPPSRATYGPALWAHILRDQLDVSEAEFWACVKKRVKPSRSYPEPPEEAIPAGLVDQLIQNGVPEDEIRGMDKAAAIERINKIWSQRS